MLNYSACIARAGQPDRNGRMYDADSLRKAAERDPTRLEYNETEQALWVRNPGWTIQCLEETNA